MNKIIDYGVVERLDLQQFLADIAALLQEGYQPYGNFIQTRIGVEGFCYAQAMVKYELA